MGSLMFLIVCKSFSTLAYWALSSQRLLLLLLGGLWHLHFLLHFWPILLHTSFSASVYCLKLRVSVMAHGSWLQSRRRHGVSSVMKCTLELQKNVPRGTRVITLHNRM